MLDILFWLKKYCADGEYAILQQCHSAVLNIHAILQPIRICFFATSNTIYSVLPIIHTIRVLYIHSYLLKGTVRIIGWKETLFATKHTFLQHLVYFSENVHLISIFPQFVLDPHIKVCFMIIISKPKLNDA